MISRGRKTIRVGCFLGQLFIALVLPAMPQDNTTEIQQKSSTQPNASSAQLSPSPVTLSTHISRDMIQVADPVELSFRLKGPKGMTVSWPDFAKQLESFDLVDKQFTNDLPAQDGSGQRIWNASITIETLVAGEYSVPALDFKCRLHDSSPLPILLRSNQVDVRVQSVLDPNTDPTAFRDIKSEIDARLDRPQSNHWAPWLIAFLVVAPVAATTYVLLFRRRKTQSAVERAQKRLVQFENAHQSTTTHYVELGRILNEFFEQQFAIKATSLSTRELLRTLRTDQRLGDDTVDRIETFLQAADAAKFTPAVSKPSDKSMALQQVRNLIADCVLSISRHQEEVN